MDDINNNNELDARKLKLLNIQMTNSWLAIISIAIFLIISYNKKLTLEGKEPIIPVKYTSDIITINRIFILGIALVSVVLKYSSYKLSKEMESEKVTHVAMLEYYASYLPLLEIIILVYIAFTYFDEIEETDFGPIII